MGWDYEGKARNDGKGLAVNPVEVRKKGGRNTMGCQGPGSRTGIWGWRYCPKYIPRGRTKRTRMGKHRHEDPE
jgi:hypothetical protein